MDQVFVSSYKVDVSRQPYSRRRPWAIGSGRSSGCSQQPDVVNESTRKVVREKPKNNQSGGRPDQSRLEATPSAQGARGLHRLVRDVIGSPGRSAIGPVGFRFGLPGTIESRSSTRGRQASGAIALSERSTGIEPPKSLYSKRQPGSTPTAADSRRDGPASHSGRAATVRVGYSTAPADPVSPRRNGSGSRTPPGSTGPTDQ